MRIGQCFFAIGETVQLQLFRQQEIRYPVKLIGYAHNTMLVTTPKGKDSQQPLLLRDGELANVRIMANSRVYGFQTKIVMARSTPYPYLHLNLPEDIEVVEVRKSLRIATKVRASCFNESDDAVNVASMPAVIVDMSVTGMRLESLRRMGRKGDKLTVMMELLIGDMEKTIEAEVEVCVVGEVKDSRGGNGDKQRFYHGVDFKNMSISDKLVLQAYVYQMILQNLNVID